MCDRRIRKRAARVDRLDHRAVAEIPVPGGLSTQDDGKPDKVKLPLTEVLRLVGGEDSWQPDQGSALRLVGRRERCGRPRPPRL